MSGDGDRHADCGSRMRMEDQLQEDCRPCGVHHCDAKMIDDRGCFCESPFLWNSTGGISIPLCVLKNWPHDEGPPPLLSRDSRDAAHTSNWHGPHLRHYCGVLDVAWGNDGHPRYPPRAFWNLLHLQPPPPPPVAGVSSMFPPLRETHPCRCGGGGRWVVRDCHPFDSVCASAGPSLSLHGDQGSACSEKSLF